jgi:hypothetical protein
VQLTFKLTAAPAAAPSAGALDIGQWVQCIAKVVITGGARCVGVPAKQTVNVRLRAFVYV